MGLLRPETNLPQAYKYLQPNRKVAHFPFRFIQLIKIYSPPSEQLNKHR